MVCVSRSCLYHVHCTDKKNRPGSAGIGLMAGQIGVGIGTAFGHASMVAKTLSRVNLELFIPNGLEIW